MLIYIYVLHPDHNWVPDHFSLYQRHTSQCNTDIEFMQQVDNITSVFK